MLDKFKFKNAMCRFIVEVQTLKEDEDDPGRTLYQMSCAIQNYLRKHEIPCKVVHCSKFQKFNRVLDKVMQEHAAKSLGTVKHQADVISQQFEETL